MTEGNKTVRTRIKYAVGILAVLFAIYYLTIPPGRVGGGLQACLDTPGDWLTTSGKVHFTGFTEIDIDRTVVDFNGDGIGLKIEPLTARLILTHDGYLLSGTINGSQVLVGEDKDLITKRAGDFRLEL